MQGVACPLSTSPWTYESRKHTAKYIFHSNEIIENNIRLKSQTNKISHRVRYYGLSKSIPSLRESSVSRRRPQTLWDRYHIAGRRRPLPEVLHNKEGHRSLSGHPVVGSQLSWTIRLPTTVYYLQLKARRDLLERSRTTDICRPQLPGHPIHSGQAMAWPEGLMGLNQNWYRMRTMRHVKMESQNPWPNNIFATCSLKQSWTLPEFPFM